MKDGALCRAPSRVRHGLLRYAFVYQPIRHGGVIFPAEREDTAVRQGAAVGQLITGGAARRDPGLARLSETFLTRPMDLLLLAQPCQLSSNAR